MPIRRTASVWLALAAVAWTMTAGTAATQSKPEDELPEGAGRKLLETSCTSCHGLDEVTKFKGFYTRAQWRDVVQTMVDYGAKLQPGEADLLADYLAEHLGRR